MNTRLTIVLASTIACAVASFPARAQDYQQQRVVQQARDAYREQVNENVLFLMGGPPGGSYLTLTHDIATVVNDGLRLRVLPVMGNAAAQNVSDVLFLRGVDLSLTMIQVINYLKQTKQYGPNIDQQLVYIAPLENDEMHVVGRRGINSIYDLKGKRVNFNNAGSATAMLGPRIFRELKIDVQPVFLAQGDAYERMRTGDIAATICICAKPLDQILDMTPESGFKLLDVPFAGALADEYLPASLTKDDYPKLLNKGEKVETIATTTVLISFNWPRGTPRYVRTAKFVDAFFAKFGDFQRPPRHPVWKSVNLAGTVQGLQRFAPAQEWLDRNEPSAVARATASKLLPRQQPAPGAAPGASPGAATAMDTDSLFRDFMDFTRKSRR
jgi:uncharacterized protein